MKEIWKRILDGVNLGRKDEPKDDPSCSCGKCQEARFKPISDHLPQVMDEISEVDKPREDDDLLNDDDESWRYVPRGLS